MPSESISAAIMERIQAARLSKIKYAHIDLFAGPFIGRQSNIENLQRLYEEIGEAHWFRRDQPLLVVSGDPKAPRGMMLVVGGGHRLVVAAQFLHIMLVPYQILDLSDLTEFGNRVSVFSHAAIISHHLEATEPRPRAYTIMQQVTMFGRLRDYWLWRQKQQNRHVAKRLRRLPSLTLPKLLLAYQELSSDTRSGSKYAIDFMSSKTNGATSEPRNSTITGYMTGAQRLLDSGVVPYLCELEDNGKATFGRRTLNRVKGWTPEKIRDTVNLWQTRIRAGESCDFKFNDKIGGEVDCEKKKQKQPPSSSSNVPPTKSAAHDLEDAAHIPKLSSTESSFPPPGPLSTPPSGWEHFLKDWHHRDSLTLVKALHSNVLEREAQCGRQLPADPQDVIDICNKAEIVKQLLEKVEALHSSNPKRSTLSIPQLLQETIAAHKSSHDRHISLLVRGGIFDKPFELHEDDYLPIVNFSNATDDSVLFTMHYLSNWHTQSLEALHILDPLLLQGWFTQILRPEKQPLLDLQKQLRTTEGSILIGHLKTWTTSITVLPIVGANHWSLAILVNLRQLADYLSTSPSSKTNSDSRIGDKPFGFYWLDSLNTSSLHDGFDTNIYLYLLACYPGTSKISLPQLRSILPLHKIRCEQQNEQECGFYVSYHISVLAKNYSLFTERTGTKHLIQRYVNAMYKSYPFSTYKIDVQARLSSLITRYSASKGSYISSPVFLWHSVSPVVTCTASASRSGPKEDSDDPKSPNDMKPRRSKRLASPVPSFSSYDEEEKLMPAQSSPKKPKLDLMKAAVKASIHKPTSPSHSLTRTAPPPKQKKPESQKVNSTSSLPPKPPAAPQITNKLRSSSCTPSSSSHVNLSIPAQKHTDPHQPFPDVKPDKAAAAPASNRSPIPTIPTSPQTSPTQKRRITQQTIRDISRASRGASAAPTSLESDVFLDRPVSSPRIRLRSIPIPNIRDPLSTKPSLEMRNAASLFENQSKSSQLTNTAVIPIQQALVGVLHGLLGLPEYDSVEKKPKILSAVLNDRIVSGKLHALDPSSSLEKAMQLMTPVVISKFRSLVSLTPVSPRQSNPALIGTPSIAPQIGQIHSTSTSAGDAVPTFSKSTFRLQREKSEYAGIVEEGESLAQHESDSLLKDEWTSCMRLMQELVQKMKKSRPPHAGG